MFAQEKAGFESEKIILSVNGEDFTKLQEKYQHDKQKWYDEKEELHNKIEAKNKKINKLKEQLSKQDNETPKIIHEQTLILEENEFFEEILDPIKNAIVISNENKEKPQIKPSKVSPENNIKANSFLSPISSENKIKMLKTDLGKSHTILHVVTKKQMNLKETISENSSNEEKFHPEELTIKNNQLCVALKW